MKSQFHLLQILHKYVSMLLHHFKMADLTYGFFLNANVKANGGLV
jgi:hypothetical protein